MSKETKAIELLEKAPEANKKLMAECPYCRQLFQFPMPHKCGSNLRKNFHGRPWRAITQYKIAELSKPLATERCKTCGGSGKKFIPRENDAPYIEPCPICKGTGIAPDCKPAVNGTEPTKLAECWLCKEYTLGGCKKGWVAPCSEPNFITGANEIQCFIDHQAGELKRLKEELWATAEWLEKQDSIAASKIADSIKQALPPNSAEEKGSE